MRPAGAVLLSLLYAVTASAAIHGAVSNGTTGNPQAGVHITLQKLEQGMVDIGSAITGADGQFTIEAPPPSGEVPYLVTADYQGVAYHGAARSDGKPVQVTVYDKTTDKSAVRLASHEVIVEPRQGRLLVSDIYTVQNASNPPKTLVGSGTDKDTIHFTAAKGVVQDFTVNLSGPTLIPLKVVATEHGKGLYGLDCTFRPGESKIEVNYRLPYDSSYSFEEPVTKSLLTGTPETGVIAPLNGVTLSGDGLEAVKQDKSQGAVFYAWKSPLMPLKFDINGFLADGAAEAAGGEGGGMGGDSANGRDAGGEGGDAASSEELSTVENQNFIFQSRWKILIVLGGALLLGFVNLYRADQPKPLAAVKSQKK